MYTLLHLCCAGLVPAFVTAATKLNEHLKQQQQHASLAALAAALLHVWSCIGCACTHEWLMAVLPAIGPAAELALAMLTGPQGGLAPNFDAHVFQDARQHAARSVSYLAAV